MKNDQLLGKIDFNQSTIDLFAPRTHSNVNVSHELCNNISSCSHIKFNLLIFKVIYLKINVKRIVDQYQSQLNWLVITAGSWWCTGKMPSVHASVCVPLQSL